MSNTFPSGLIGDVVSFNYRRRLSGTRESWHELCVRTIDGIAKLGKFADEEKELVFRLQRELKALTSGRWLWVGGTEWIDKPENFAGAYNCQSSNMTDWAAFGYAMNFAMMGTGTGGVLEDKYISQLPVIRNNLSVRVVGEIGAVPKGERQEDTLFVADDEGYSTVTIIVGDSRKGWVTAYQAMLELSTADTLWKQLDVTVDISNVRPNGEKLKGFGGTANPIKLAGLFPKLANITNKAIGRKLTSVECCLIMDEAALVVVAGNVRRCLPEDALVHTDKGYIAIKDINVGDLVQTPLGLRKVLNKFDQGVQEVFKIETPTDVKPRATANHRVAVICPDKQLDFAWRVKGGEVADLNSIFWKPVSGLSENDLLVHRFDALSSDSFTVVHEDVPCVAGEIISIGNIQTYDIEVEEAHCFYCDGFLTHNSAGMRQGSSTDEIFEVAKENLWQCIDGAWKIDPERDALRMANHTRVFHQKPSQTDVINSVRKQYHSGEGAIQWAGEAIARSNADLLNTEEKKQTFLEKYSRTEYEARIYLSQLGYYEPEQEELDHRMSRYGLNPCGEILGSDFFCNLVEIHLNQIDPHNYNEQDEAFRAATLSVCALLHHDLSALGDRFAYSREIDPIIGVSFTGLFDFFVNFFGRDWLDWWAAGRPSQWTNLEEKLGELEALNQYGSFEYLSDWFKWIEADYLKRWREVVETTAKEYCARHGLRLPNRCTTTQPAGCLDRTALRIFDQGLLYADEIVAEGSGETVGLDLSVRNGIPTNTAIANQPLNLVKVTLNNGRILRMTPNHRLSIAGEWVRADQMQTGMRIDYSLGEYRHNEDALLLGVNPDHYTREYRQQTVGHSIGLLSATIATPTMLNPELAYFLGCIFGNGSMGRDQGRVRIAFNTQDMGFAQSLQEIGKRQFGLEGRISFDSRSENKAELCFGSKQLFDWLCLNQLQKTSSKELDRIPLAIRKSSRETILAFFCGLIDTDGCVREKGSLSIDSASESFVRNLQQVGEAVGLSFSVFHNVHGQNLQGQKNMWGLCLSRMLSNADSLAYLNIHSRKCQLRPLATPKRQFAFYPYQIASIEFESIPDYSYDFAVSGVDDDDSWYWQGSIKSHNTKSLLTGASAGWHPSYAPYFIRRVTKAVNDPVALAAIALGYSVVPAQTDKDENGNLLTDPHDPRCTEWLIEIPYAMPWADVADGIDFNFSALAQFDFYMQVQQHYTTHNTSATISLRESEIEPLANAIYESIQNDTGYISAALLARFDENQTFPRLPFEAIDKATYEKLASEVKERQQIADFDEALALYDNGKEYSPEVKACEGVKCELSSAIDEAKQAAMGFEVEVIL